MKKKTILLSMVTVLLFCGLALARSQTISGVVSDSHCGVKHSVAGSAECIFHCVQGGASYVLVSDGQVYHLDGQDKFKGLAGREVVVTGKIKGSTIVVKSVTQKAS